ncbi:MAG: VWA domain-containing protein [Chloroflexi bacterium]|nr:VWA domain-containing protein [Chloroflexota bacterium]
MKRFIALLASILFFALPASSVLADGVIIPHPIIERPEPVPNLIVKYHRVNVTINNQLAVTHIDQVFTNASNLELEGDYIFPLPEDAAISQFVMWVDGKRIEAQVLSADEARSIYEEIVRSRRDPALLEYVGRNAFRARVYPIAPYGEVRLEIEYSEELPSDGGLVRYVYPLNTEKFSAQPLEQVSVSVVITSNQGLKAIYSPSHEISVSRDGSNSAHIGYEEANVTPDKDFVLYYGADNADLGANLLSYRMGEDGYFTLLLSPPAEVEDGQVIAKDVTIILDTSGSMRGDKLGQARRAADYILGKLGSEDRFNIIRFATDVQQFRAEPVPTTEVEKARGWLNNMAARGGTNISRALETAFSQIDTDRPQLVLFLTDGLPTEGEIDPNAIIDQVSSQASSNTRLFVFGVGDDVNTFLLDTLSSNHRGVSVYVRPGQDIDTEVAALYNKIGQPLLTDVTVELEGADTFDVYPYPLTDLYAGSQTSVVGRYQTGGKVVVKLSGKLNGKAVEYSFSNQQLASEGGEELVPRIWATRKIGYLLTQIRLHGADSELVDEVVDLSLRYGIITPYTSFLIDETEDVLSLQGREAAAKALATSAPANEAEGAAASQAVGAEAVQKSVDQDALRDAEVAQNGSAQVKTVGNKSFILQSGTWVDTLYQASQPTHEILYGSDRYFQLLDEFDWGRYLALGADVIVVADGEAYHIGPQGQVQALPASSSEAVFLEQIIQWVRGLLQR